jgi:hypothetical protein
MPGSSPPNEPPSPAAKIQQSIEIWNRKMKSIIFGLVVMLSFLSVGFGAYCSGAPDAGERTNNFPIYDAPLRFVRSVKNAMLFEAGPPNATFPVVHLWGTPYEVGYAQGELLKPVLKEFVYKTWYYMSSELVAALSGPVLPQWAKRALVQKTLDRSLDWTAEMTANFTSQSYYDEVRGLADATGISYDLIYRYVAHYFLILRTKFLTALCSVQVEHVPRADQGAVLLLRRLGERRRVSPLLPGTAPTPVTHSPPTLTRTPSPRSNTGHSYQLRALDFDTVGPFKDFPQVTIYHPSEGHAFASVRTCVYAVLCAELTPVHHYRCWTYVSCPVGVMVMGVLVYACGNPVVSVLCAPQVGWPGTIGVLSGFSDQQLAISEIGVSI